MVLMADMYTATNLINLNIAELQIQLNSNSTNAKTPKTLIHEHNFWV